MRHVLDCFPHSQHRPSLITTSSLIQPTGGKPVHRWNFRKASWPEFEREIDVTAGTLPVTTADNIDDAYTVGCCSMLPKSTFRGVAEPTTSRAGMTSVKICCVHTQKQHQVRKEYQQQTSLPGSTTSAKQGGRKPSSQLTSSTQADEHGRPSTS